MKEGKVLVSFGELEVYRKKLGLEENLLSKFIIKKKAEGNIKESTVEIKDDASFNEAIYTIYKPKNMVIFKGILSNDALLEQVFLSSEYANIAIGSKGDTLEIKTLFTNKPEDYGMYYLQSDGKGEIIGTNLALSKESFLVLLTLADYKREKKALSFLMHQVEEKEIKLRELQEIYDENIDFKDPRWFIGFFSSIFKETIDYSFEKGIKELVQAGFLSINNEVVEIAEEVNILLSILQKRQAVLAYENYYIQSENRITKDELLFIKCDGALFSVKEIEGAFSFTSIDYDIAEEILEVVFNIVYGLEEEINTEDKLAEVIKKEDVEDKIITVKESDNTIVCTNCGSKANNKSKFCNRCGTELIKEKEEVKSTRYCGQCGNKLSNKSKFCTKCGTLIEK